MALPGAGRRGGVRDSSDLMDAWLVEMGACHHFFRDRIGHTKNESLTVTDELPSTSDTRKICPLRPHVSDETSA